MAYYYSPKEYITAAKRRIEREDAVAETSLSSYIAMSKAEEAKSVIQPKEEKEVSFLQRAGETILDFGKNILDGTLKAFEGVMDFGASAVGVIAGWAGNNDLKDKISDFVAYDAVNEGIYGGRTDFFQNSFINDMSETGQRIVRGVGQGIGQMLPLVALTVATGGIGGAAGWSAKTTATVTKVANLTALGMSAAGGATEQALNDEVYNEDGTKREVSLDRAFLYGLANGAVEVATERLIGDGIYENMFGEGVVNKLVNRLGKSQGFSKAVKFALNAFGEGAEEVASEAVANTLKTIYNSKDGKVHWEAPDVQAMFEAGVIGTLTAAAMNGGDAAVRKVSTVASAQDTATEISNIERRMEALAADNNYSDEIRSELEREHEANLKKLESIYGRANEKQRAKIERTAPIISTLLGADGKLATSTLGEGVTPITEQQARSEAMSPSLYARRNEVANNLHSQGATLASDMTDVQTENVRTLRTVLKKAGTKTGKGLKVVVAENLRGANAYITKDYFVISKEQLNSKADMAKALAHESTHFSEETEEYKKLEKFFKDILSERAGTRDFQATDGSTFKAKNMLDQIFLEVTERYNISDDVIKAFQTGEMPQNLSEEEETRFAYELKLLNSEMMALGSEYVLGSEEMIDRLVESERGTARKMLRRIKDRIALIENAFKGDKSANAALKELRKAEKLFSDALAASGEKYLHKAYVDRNEEKKAQGTELDNSENVQYSKKDKLIGKTFPYYSESFSEANERATRWAKGESIEVGWKKLVSYNGNWYLIEKFSDVGSGYQIVDRLNSREYELYAKEIRRYEGEDYGSVVDEGIRINENGRGKQGSHSNEIAEARERSDLSQMAEGGSEEGRYSEERRRDRQQGIKDRGGVNDTQYSLRDSEGRALTPEQAAFFKDSKVIDEDGNLLPLYHGTRDIFTVFDRSKTGASNELAKVGFWFTPSQEGAVRFSASNWYGEGDVSRAIKVYLDIKNPKVYQSEQVDEKKIDALWKEANAIDEKMRGILENVENKTYSYYRAFHKLLEGETVDPEKYHLSDIQYSRVQEQAYDYKEMRDSIKQINDKIVALRYVDAYEKFRTDIYKYMGMNAEDANAGGAGMAWYKDGKFQDKAPIIEQYRNDLIKEGYDGIFIVGTRYDAKTMGDGNTQYVAFDSNQIKLTTNENPTANDDIRYSLRQTTRKHYTQEEVAQIINGIQGNLLQVEEGAVTISSKKKLQDLLWNLMNTTEEGKGDQIKVATRVAEFIMENAMLRSVTDDAALEEHYMTVDALRKYLHSVDLSGIRAEVKSRYDTDNSVYALWSKKGGIKPDVLGQALQEEGFPIRATNEAEIFFEIADAYSRAAKAIRDSAKKHLSKIMTESERNELKNQIALSVLRSFDEKGSATSLAKEYEKAQRRIKELKELLEESRKYNQRLNAVLDLANELKPAYVKSHHKSSMLADENFMRAISGLSKIKWRSDIRKQGARKVLAAFADWYNIDNRLLNGDMDTDPVLKSLAKTGSCGYLNRDVLFALEYLKGKVDERTTLTFEELQLAEMVLKSAKWLLNNYDKVNLRGKMVTLSEESRAARAVVDKYAGMHSKNVVADLIKKFQYNTSEPRAVFLSMFGYEDGGAFMQAFRDVLDGETKSGAIRLELITKIDEFMRDHKNYKKRLANDTITVAGHEINVQVAISLYMLSVQEHSIPGLKEGGWGYTDKMGYWVDCGKLTDEDIKALASALSEADKDFVKTLRAFFDKGGEYMKATDELLKGYSTITLENSDYFPIIRYSKDRAEDIDKRYMLAMSNASVQNMGITKTRTENKLRLDVHPILSVVERHAKQIGQYAGLAVPIKTIQQVYNCNVSQESGGGSESIRNTIDQKVWNGFDRYFTNWLADVQGMGKMHSEADSFVDRIRSNYAKFQLGANIKVVLSQMASFPTAFCVLSASSMVRAYGHKPNLNNMDKYCAWARVRNADHGVVLAEGNLDKIGAVGDVFTKPIQLTDRLTIGFLWNACQCEVESKHKGDAAYKFGTEANMEEAAALLEEVGRLTQPNYTQSERSAMQRSSSSIVKSLTMFFSVPLKQYSRLIESIGRIRALRYKKNVLHENVSAAEMNAARKSLAKTATAVTVANLIYALMGQLVKFLLNKDRKDKDGEEIGWVEDLFKDFASTSIGMIPLVKEVYNVFNGFEMEEAVTSTINDFVKGAKGAVELIGTIGDDEPHEARDYAKPLRDFIYASGQILGIPTRNLYNLIFGVVNRFDESEAYKWNSLFYAQNYAKDLKKAIEEGDEGKASTIVGLMMKDDGMTSTSPLVNKKLRELYGKGYAVLPKTVRDSITYEGETIKLSAKSQKAFKDTYSGANKEVENLIKASYFNKLSEEVQAKSIKWIYDYYYESAVCETVGEESNSKKMLFAETMPVSKFAMSIAACSAVKGKVDKKGNTIAGTKKAEVLKLLNKLSLTRAEKVLILAYLGYSVDRYASIIKSYISRIGLTKAQQKAFLAYCGL